MPTTVFEPSYLTPHIFEMSLSLEWSLKFPLTSNFDRMDPFNSVFCYLFDWFGCSGRFSILPEGGNKLVNEGAYFRASLKMLLSNRPISKNLDLFTLAALNFSLSSKWFILARSDVIDEFLTGFFWFSTLFLDKDFDCFEIAFDWLEMGFTWSNRSLPLSYFCFLFLVAFDSSCFTLDVTFLEESFQV